MWQALGASVDAVHALLMVGWVAGYPLLFLRRRPRLTRAYALFALAFVIVSQASRFVFGECVFTTMARWLWNHPGAGAHMQGASSEWFTVRLSNAVFGMAPSHRAIAITSEILAAATATGVLLAMRRSRSAHSG